MITKPLLSLTAVLSILRCCALQTFSHSRCVGGVLGKEISTNLIINSKKDDSGQWITTFHASKDVSKDSANNITVNITQSVIQCDSDQTVHITGVIKEIKSDDESGRLTFSPVCGINAAIINNGRSAQKLNLEDPVNGVLLTNRPLKYNELFEVRLDKKDSRFDHSYAIGVTVHQFNQSSQLPTNMYLLKSGNWMMFENGAYQNGVLKIKNYGENVDLLKVGDRAGVMVTESGTLHYFINGVDQGPAASNIPFPVYGVFQLHHNTIKGTIVDSSK